MGENSGPILAVSGPKFMKFWDYVGELCGFQCCFLIVYTVFLAGDIDPQICH